MKRMKVSQLTWDHGTWSRDQADVTSATVDAYTKAMQAGASFPAIEIQRVSNYSNASGDATLIMDGVHRWHAYKKGGIKEIDVIEWLPERIDYEARKIDIMLACVERNTKHGDRLSNSDKKASARRIATLDTDGAYTEKQIAGQFAVTRKTINNWISDIRARQKASRDAIIYRLALLGWTQARIGDKVELGQSAVSRIMKNGNFTKIHTFVSQGKSMKWVAEHFGLDLTTTWALRLEGLSDKQRMESLGITIKKYNVWNYTSAHDLMGSDKFNGRIPGEIVANTLYWFTEQGDRILDPMAGSGTTVDACLLMGRDCYAYDLNPSREDIIGNDIRQGYPDDVKRPSFIFVDPPYWNMKMYNEGEEGAMGLEKFYQMIESLASHSYNLLREGDKMAVLMGNQAARKWLPSGVERLDHVQAEYEIFTNAGFEKVWAIWVPMPTQNAQRWAQAEWDNHRMGEITRELTIWQK